MEITFTNPIYLWFLVSIPFLILTHFFTLRYVKRRAMRFANFEAISRVTGGQALSKNITLLFIRMFTLLFLILSAAGIILWYRGQSSDYNYVLTIDASGSMLADDIEPNRLEAAKEAAILFVDNLKSRAKIGVVSFSGVGSVEQRLEEDYTKTKETIKNIYIKTIHGTAIGDALVASSNLLVTEDKAKLVILLTDGRENIATEEELRKVIEHLKDEHVTVNTIGIGTSEGGMLPGIEMISTLDEPTLITIAEETNGKYYRADDKNELEEIYKAMATATEADLPVKLSVPFMLAALALLFLEWGLINTKYRTIP